MFLQTTLLQPLIQSPASLIVYSVFDSHKQSDNMDLCHSTLLSEAAAVPQVNNLSINCRLIPLSLSDLC